MVEDVNLGALDPPLKNFKKRPQDGGGGQRTRRAVQRRDNRLQEANFIGAQ